MPIDYEIEVAQAELKLYFDPKNANYTKINNTNGIPSYNLIKSAWFEPIKKKMLIKEPEYGEKEDRNPEPIDMNAYRDNIFRVITANSKKLASSNAKPSQLLKIGQSAKKRRLN
jgi:hypothetical protein